MFSAIILALPWTSARSMTRSSMIGKSLAVATACTPGRASAWLVSMARMRAWAWGLRGGPCHAAGLARDLVHTVMAEGPRPHHSELAWARALFTRCDSHTFSLLDQM